MSKVNEREEAYPDTDREIPENYDLATHIVGECQDDISGTLGTLLTQAEVLLPAEDSRLEAYKDQIRREFSIMRNRIQDIIYFRLDVQELRHTPGNIYITSETALNKRQ